MTLDLALSKAKFQRHKKECPVCLNTKYCKVGLFQCKDRLCGDCFKQMKKRVCPLCRADATKIDCSEIKKRHMEFKKSNGII